MLNVIDISGWQAGLDLEKLYSMNPALDGVIVKATGGSCIFQADTFIPWATWLKDHGKPWGFYHFLNDDFRGRSGREEAEFFVEKTRDWFGYGVPVADYEQQAKSLGTAYLKEFLDTVFALTGIKPVLYCSQSVANQRNMTEIANAGYQLWMAQYASYNPMYDFTDNPWHRGSVSPFPKYIMQQYTSQLHIPGWRSNLDASLFLGDRSDWDKLVSVEPVFPPTPKSIDDLAREVINGKWGSGKFRRDALEAAGYDYQAVQERVNEILGVKPKKTAEAVHRAAVDCISGKYGNGAVRVIKLRLAGFDPTAVQAEVNRILGGR